MGTSSFCSFPYQFIEENFNFNVSIVRDKWHELLLKIPPMFSVVTFTSGSLIIVCRGLVAIAGGGEGGGGGGG